MTWDQLIEEVDRRRLTRDGDRAAEELTDELGTGRLVFSCELGTMPHWMAMKNMAMIAEEVMPHFRAPDGKPVWAKEERAAPFTRSELAAQKGKPPTARVRIDGAGYIDPAVGHIPELMDAAKASNGDGRSRADTEETVHP